MEFLNVGRTSKGSILPLLWLAHHSLETPLFGKYIKQDITH